MLQFFAPRAIPGVELVENNIYRRTFSLHGHTGWMQATLDDSASAIDLRIHYAQPRFLFLMVERVRRMFDLSADPDQIAAHFRRDPVLASRVAAQPGLRVPGCWDGFELSIRAILGQQVTVRGASTLAGRLVREFGTPLADVPGLTHVFPAPEKLADADFTRIGLPKARAHCIRSLARAVCDGTISFSGIVDVEDFLARLRQLPGIGEWTAQYIAMRALGEPDAFPSSDLGLLHASDLTNPRQLESRSQAWLPWRAYAAMYLWQVVPRKGVTRNAHLLHSHGKSARAAAAGR
jgi:AraC family transcriptional regulator of adaptative response / DNA-3-methyladenine glycosylase II